MIFNNKEMNYNLHQKCGIIVDFILKASMARKSFDNITCVIIALKDNLDNNHYYNNKKNIYNNNINDAKNGNHHKKLLKDINNEFKITPPSNLPKGSYNALSQIKANNNGVELYKRRIKGNTLNTERYKNIKNIIKIFIKYQIQEKLIRKIIKKKNINKNNKIEIGNKTIITNVKKILNKSDISHRNIKKMESERTHSKKNIYKKKTTY